MVSLVIRLSLYFKDTWHKLGCLLSSNLLLLEYLPNHLLPNLPTPANISLHKHMVMLSRHLRVASIRNPILPPKHQHRRILCSSPQSGVNFRLQEYQPILNKTPFGK